MFNVKFYSNFEYYYYKFIVHLRCSNLIKEWSNQFYIFVKIVEEILVTTQVAFMYFVYFYNYHNSL